MKPKNNVNFTVYVLATRKVLQINWKIYESNFKNAGLGIHSFALHSFAQKTKVQIPNPKKMKRNYTVSFHVLGMDLLQHCISILSFLRYTTYKKNLSVLQVTKENLVCFWLCSQNYVHICKIQFITCRLIVLLTPTQYVLTYA